MDSSNLSSSELPAALSQLLSKQATTTLQQLTALREAFDAAARAVATAPSHIEQDVRDLAGRISAAEEAEIRRIREEAHAAIQSSRAELQARVGEHEKLAAALARTEAERALLRGELETARRRLEGAEQDLAITIEAHAELQSQLQELEAASAREAAGRTSLEGDLSQAHATIEQLLADVESLRAEAEKHTAEKAGLRAQIERHASEASSLQAQLHEARDIRQQRDALAAQHESSEARIHGLEAQLADTRGIAHQRDQLTGQLESAGHRIAELEHEIGAARRSQDEHQQHLAGELELAGRRIRELERELGEARGVGAHRDQLASQLDASSRRVQQLEAELSISRQTGEERDRFAVEAEAAHRRVHELESAVAELRKTGGQRPSLAAELDATGARLQQLEAVNASQLDQIRQLTTRLEEALRSEVQLQEKLAGRPAQMPQPNDTDLEIMRAEVDRMVALLDASARAVTEMAAAPNANDLLTELLKRLSLQFSRVALFRVKNGKLEGEQQVGFEDAAAVTKLTFPLSADSILARAVHSGNIESVTGPDSLARTGLPFGGAPTAAVAVPILVQGSTLAVVYGDDAEMPDWARGPAVHDSSVGFARLLVGQVSVLLVRHTQEMKALEELREYATTLVQEAKEMYLADAQAGKAPELLRSRLKDNLECASQLYAYRAAMEGTAAAALLDDRIVAELEQSTPFARDLATVVAGMAAGDLQITAEAS